MKFIALDLSLSHLIIIYGDHNNLYLKRSIKLRKDRAGIMFSNLEEIIRELKIDLNSLDMLFSTIGPGNFNGIRISLSLIKGLAIANNTKIAGLSSLELISRSFENVDNKNIFAIIKASPDFYYIEVFNNLFISMEAPRLIDINDKIKFSIPDSEMIFVGNDAKNVAEAQNFKGKFLNISNPTPESLYSLVKNNIVKNNFIDASPLYLREVNAIKPSSWKRKPTVN